MENSNENLDQLFRAYRDACPAPEVSANFMPGLWKKIDKRRSLTWKLKVYSRGLMTAAAGLCLVMFGMQWVSSPAKANPVYAQTYLEALENDNPIEFLAFTEGSPLERGR
jgi:hypothetical protein